MGVAMRELASSRRSRTSVASTASSDDDPEQPFVPSSGPTLLAGARRSAAASADSNSSAAAAITAGAPATSAAGAATASSQGTRLADVRLHPRDAERVRRTTLAPDYLDDERRAARWAREYREAAQRGTPVSQLPVCPAPRVNGKPVGTLLEFMLHLVLGSVLGVIGFGVSAVMASSHASRAGGLTGVGLLLIFGGSWVGVVAGTTHAPVAGAALISLGVLAVGYSLLHMRAVLQLVNAYTRSRHALVDDIK